MTTHKKGKRTFEDLITDKADRLTLSVVNELLKEARIDAEFSIEDEQVYDIGEVCEGSRVTLIVKNFDKRK